MSFALTRAAGLARPPPMSRRATSAGLFMLALCPPSIASPGPASQSSPSHYLQPTCPLNRDTTPAALGVRSLHAASHGGQATAQFSYHVAASYSAKQHRFNAAENLFTNPPYDPHPAQATDVRACKDSLGRKRRVRSGQDSFFYSQVGNTHSTAFGVADGVGGWVTSGVDPADFAHGLCEYMACAARLWPHGANTTALHPKDLLQLAYDQVRDDGSIDGGGSTACLAVAAPDGHVEVANLGDSGFMHLGLNAMRHFTEPQTHAFNTPYQLSKTPLRMLVQMAVFGGPASLSDKPKDASVTHHKVRHGDVLVFATDGVWDNLSPQDTLGIVSRHMVHSGAWVEKDGVLEVGPQIATLVQAHPHPPRQADGESLQARVATAIAKTAKQAGLNTRRDGPFAKEVQRHFPRERWHGGKPDDIAAVVAIVLEAPAQRARL